jgi:polar amino acid transport system substrate-binding protein
MWTFDRARVMRAGAACLGLLVLLAGCAPTRPAAPPPPPRPVVPELRIGVTLDSPPFVMQQGNQMVGIEIDFAMRLSSVLRRPLRVIALNWNELIPSLLNGRIDMIMSGMTITRLRSLRVAFSDPYMDSGLSVLIRSNLAENYKTPASVMSSSLRLGVTKGTTAASYVNENYRGGQVFPFLSNSDGVADLVPGRIDAFVTDAPIVAWFAAEHEGILVPLIRPLLTHEQLGWGFRPQDDSLRLAANDALAGWRAEGFVGRTLRKWIPLYEGH